MNPTTQAAMERLQAVLDAPLPPTRHPQVVALAERRATEGPPEDVTFKQVALAEIAEPVEHSTGEVVALVSDYGLDRDGERFALGAWDNAIAKIKAAGRPLPLLFGHASNSPSTVVGMAAPDDLWADERGLWLRGWLDTTDSLGQRIYRMVQKGVLTWSVGFRPARKHRENGVTVFDEVDELLEVSLTPIPANSRTFTASAKAAAEDREAPSLEELRQWERDLGLTGHEEAERWQQETLDGVRATLDQSSAKSVQAKAERVAREVGPVQVAVFEC